MLNQLVFKAAKSHKSGLPVFQRPISNKDLQLGLNSGKIPCREADHGHGTDDIIECYRSSIPNPIKGGHDLARYVMHFVFNVLTLVTKPHEV